jgi:hypothetical protein
MRNGHDYLAVAIFEVSDIRSILTAPGRATLRVIRPRY